MQTKGVIASWLGVGLMVVACSGGSSGTSVQETSGAEQPAVDVSVIPIPNARITDEGILVGGQPSAEQLQALAKAGYRTVVSLRTAGEPGSENEADLVKELGMRFVSIPVRDARGLTVENAQALAVELAAIDAAPLVLHCGTGNRAGALLGLKEFVVDGVEAEEAIEFAKEVGMTKLEPALRSVIQQLCEADLERDCDL